MLNLDRTKFAIIGLLIVGCNFIHNSDTDRYAAISKGIVGEKEYHLVYGMLIDTVDMWVLNKLHSLEAETIYPYKIDSLLCFNKTGDRFITCRHLYVNVPDATSDELRFYYGEKINSKWYFSS